jgi:hypothetical protein
VFGINLKQNLAISGPFGLRLIAHWIGGATLRKKGGGAEKLKKAQAACRRAKSVQFFCLAR